MSTLKRSTPIALTIRKKPITAKVPSAKYYDPINRIGENVVVRIGGDDRLGNLYEGDTLVTNEKDVPTGHINMAYHVVTGDFAKWAIASQYYVYGALQTGLPKLNPIIQSNPVQNKETAPAQKTSMVLTDVHEDDVAAKYAIREKLYAVPENAPTEYAALTGAMRFTVCKESTFLRLMANAINNAPATVANPTDELKARYYVGRAHNGKAVGYGNVYYTLPN